MVQYTLELVPSGCFWEYDLVGLNGRLHQLVSWRTMGLACFLLKYSHERSEGLSLCLENPGTLSLCGISLLNQSVYPYFISRLADFLLCSFL